MSVSIDYQEDTSNVSEVLLHAQAIADAFTKALDQNECSVKILIGIAEQIRTDKKKVEDLYEFSENPSVNLVDKSIKDSLEGDLVEDYLVDEKDTSLNMSFDDIQRAVREQCLDCEFNFPILDMSNNFNWSFDRLKASLQVFENVFNKILNPNLCHVANAFTYSCIPSIISLIMLLVAAYASILALQKLGGISLSAFIQGLITGLLGLLIANLSLRLDTSNTGVNCLIEALREIANNIVSQQETISGAIPSDLLTSLGYTGNEQNGYVRLDKNLEEDLTDELQELGGNTSTKSETDSNWTQKAYLETYANLSMDERSYVDRYLDQAEDEMAELNKSVSSAFNSVTEVVENMTNSLNEELNSIFGLLDFFQCESERSGTNFSDILEHADKIINVINVLSAILFIIAKKAVKKLCKTKDSVRELTTVLEDNSYVGDPLTELEQVEVIEEFLGKVTELTKDSNDNLVPLIYDKDKESVLPKLSLKTCNLRDFVEKHSLENVIKEVIKELNREAEEENNVRLDPTGNNTRTPLGFLPPSNHVIDKDNWIEYPVKYVKPKYEIKTGDDLTTKIITEVAGSAEGVSSGIQSILDLVYNNPLDNKKNASSNVSTGTVPTDNNDSITNKDYREFIKAPLSVDISQKKAFENKCRDISDVLNILGTLKKT